QVVPTLERFIVGVTVVPVHDRLKLTPIDRLEQCSKSAIDVAHARSFLSLDNQKEPICIGSAEHAPRHSESFPGQACRLRGEGRGEGDSQRNNSRRVPLTRTAKRSDLSPQAGRGASGGNRFNQSESGFSPCCRTPAPARPPGSNRCGCPR